MCSVWRLPSQTWSVWETTVAPSALSISLRREEGGLTGRCRAGLPPNLTHTGRGRKAGVAQDTVSGSQRHHELGTALLRLSLDCMCCFKARRRCSAALASQAWSTWATMEAPTCLIVRGCWRAEKARYAPFLGIQAIGPDAQLAIAAQGPQPVRLPPARTGSSGTASMHQSLLCPVSAFVAHTSAPTCPAAILCVYTQGQGWGVHMIAVLHTLSLRTAGRARSRSRGPRARRRATRPWSPRTTRR